MSFAGKKELEIAMREHRPVSLIYLDSEGAISQRVVQVKEVTEDGVKGYCFKRREPRTFRADRILAVSLQVPRSGMQQRMYRRG